ncbi:MAG: hypothetical protein DRN96_06550 [Thermoproteota archaeon]|nr:MAG: hypothetical protein DRN96_06550 [Candidatus Korarchaeota archaeon]
MEAWSRDLMTPLQLIIAVSVGFTLYYFLGKLWNRRLQRELWRRIRPELARRYGSFSFMPLGSSGFRILAAKPKGGGPRKLELDLLLLDRENLVHYPVQLALGEVDKVVVKANLKSRPKARLEAASRSYRPASRLEARAPSEGLLDAGEGVVAWSDRRVEGLRVLLSSGAARALSEGALLRISVSPEEPNLIVQAKACESGVKAALEVAERIYLEDWSK